MHTYRGGEGESQNETKANDKLVFFEEGEGISADILRQDKRIRIMQMYRGDAIVMAIMKYGMMKGLLFLLQGKRKGRRFL